MKIEQIHTRHVIFDKICVGGRSHHGHFMISLDQFLDYYLNYKSEFDDLIRISGLVLDLSGHYRSGGWFRFEVLIKFKVINTTPFGSLRGLDRNMAPVVYRGNIFIIQ